MPELSGFQKKLAEKRAQMAAEQAQKNPLPADTYADLIPEDDYTLSDADVELDQAVDGIDIIDAYRKWCGKMEPKVSKGQRENIMISCPVPGHADKNPSAAINLDKQVWSCYACGKGGDAHDLAAYHYGHDVPGYKTDGSFPALRRRMAEDFGYRFERSAITGITYVVPPVEENEFPGSTDDSKPEEETEADSSLATVTPIVPTVTVESGAPLLEWQNIVPRGTFLDIYMRQCVIDDNPEEFHFWNGMVALGLALGRQARLYDGPPVHGNLFICLLAPSGTGKSKSMRHLNDLLDQALPASEDPENRGVRRIRGSASAESLIWEFQKPVIDPSDTKGTRVLYNAPVTGLIEYNELGALMGRVRRQGSVLEEALLEFYDCVPVVKSRSMTSGEKIAEMPFASAITTSQPRVLNKLLSRADDDSGFLNRWLFVIGRPKKRLSIGGLMVDITPAVKPLQKILGWSGTFGDKDFLDLSPEAFTVWDEFFHGVLEPMQRDKGEYSSVLQRLDLLMKKMILLLAANKMERVITVETVEEAKMLYPYFLESYGVPEREIKKTESSEVEDAIIEKLKGRTDGLTANYLSKLLARRYERYQVKRALETLHALGEVSVSDTPSGRKGPSTERYFYNAG